MQNKGRDVVSVHDFGAVGDGVADDTAALQAAFATGKSVIGVGGASYKVTAALAYSASRQEFFGNGCRIVPSGNFNLFSAGGARYGCSLHNVTVDAAGMTGGYIFAVNTADRITISDTIIYNPWNGVEVIKNNMCLLQNVYINNIRGTVGIRWYGDASNRSDVLRLIGVTMSSTTAHATGIDWDGNCHTLQVQTLVIVGPNYGIRVRNTAGATAPAFGMFDDLEVDFPTLDAVRIEAGEHFYFTPLLYLHGSVGGSGIYVSTSIPADHVMVTGGKITSHARYGIENGTSGGSNSRVREINAFFLGNTLGNIQGPSMTRSLRFQLDNTGYFDFNGGNPLINFDANDFYLYNRTANRHSLNVNSAAQLIVGDGTLGFTAARPSRSRPSRAAGAAMRLLHRF